MLLCTARLLALSFFVRHSSVMKIDRAGYPFIGGALVPAAVAAVAKRPALATSLPTPRQGVVPEAKPDALPQPASRFLRPSAAA